MNLSPRLFAAAVIFLKTILIFNFKKWVFTGGDDGFIRKYDFVASMNAEQMLTHNQRQGLVDSIVKVKKFQHSLPPTHLFITSNLISNISCFFNL